MSPRSQGVASADESSTTERVLRSKSRIKRVISKRSCKQPQIKRPFKMGQSNSMMKRYRHHRDPIALNADTLGVREHMFGESDMVILVKGVRFPVNKTVLMEHSPYFNSMLTQFEERFQDEIELKELVDPALIGQAIYFIYFKNIYLTPKNVQNLLCLANYLQIESLQRVCSDYIRARIDKYNCVALYLFTMTMGPRELHCHAEDFILSHFEQVIKKAKDFHSLTMEQLQYIISSDRLLVSSEGTVYKAVMHWVAHDPKERSCHLPKLLQHVHFPLMSPNELAQYQRRDSRVKKNKNLAIALEEAKKYFTQCKEERIQYWEDKSKPARWPKIFVVMRMYWKNLPMEYYDFRSKSWHTLTQVQNWRSCAALVAHRSNVYLVGGEEVDQDSPTGSRTVNRVTRYDCEMQRWSSAPSMTLARRWAASVVLEDTLYVIGGIGGKGGTYERRLDSVECLDLSQPKGKSKWKMLASMSTARSSHTVEVLDGKIYVVGGGDGKEWLCSSEVYNPKKNKWSLISNLRTKRWKCGLCVLNGYLYAIGGMDSPSAGFWGSPLSSVERYFPATDEWTEVAPMSEARFGSAVVAYQGRIYVSGGFGEDKSILSSTECYDPDTNKWSKIAPMRKMCGFVGGVLVDRPIQMDEQDEESAKGYKISSRL